MMRLCLVALSLLLLAACETNYAVPEPSSADLAAANQRLATAQAQANVPRLSTDQSARNFRTVVARVEPVAERFCLEETRDRKDANCDFRIVLDRNIKAPPNAFHTIRDGQPIVAFTIAMIAEARNQDELAFVMGHEAGHYIANHLEKIRQQQVATALVLGTIAAAGSEGASSAIRSANIADAVEQGAVIGRLAYSKEFELEADVLGAIIARRAGYDPNKGALMFARARGRPTAAFLSTHPPSAQRLAVVAATTAN